MTTFLISFTIIFTAAFSFLVWYYFKIILPEKKQMKEAEKENKKLYKWFHDQQKRLHEDYKNEVRNFK